MHARQYTRIGFACVPIWNGQHKRKTGVSQRLVSVSISINTQTVKFISATQRVHHKKPSYHWRSYGLVQCRNVEITWYQIVWVCSSNYAKTNRGHRDRHQMQTFRLSVLKTKGSIAIKFQEEKARNFDKIKIRKDWFVLLNSFGCTISN